MVKRENSLDDVILQIFEDQEDVFHFPVTTQREARAFVKALHLKGVAYEALYTAVEEFEPNFTSWRKGLGKPGIGNRVIERINQPLQEILLSDAEEENDEEEEKSIVRAQQASSESAKTATESPNEPISGTGSSDKKIELNSASPCASNEIKGLESTVYHQSNHEKSLNTNRSKTAIDNGVKSDKLKPESKIKNSELSTKFVKPTEASTNNGTKQCVISTDEKLTDNQFCETKSVQHLNSESKTASKITAKVDTQLEASSERQRNDDKLKVDSSMPSRNPTVSVQGNSLDIHQSPVALLQVKSACNSESDESFVSVGSDMDRAVSPQESAAVFPDEKVVNSPVVSNKESNNQVSVEKTVSTPKPVQPVIPESATVVFKNDESLIKKEITNDVAKVNDVANESGANKGFVPTRQTNVQTKESISNKTDTNSQRPVVELTNINEQTLNKNDKAIKTVVPVKDQKITDNVPEGEKKVTNQVTNNNSSPNKQNNVEKTNSTILAKTSKTSEVETNKAKLVEASKEIVNKDIKIDDKISVTKVTAPKTVDQGGKKVSNNPLLTEPSSRRKISSQNDTAEKETKAEIVKKTEPDVNQNVVTQNTTLVKNNESAAKDIITKSDPLPNKINESTLGPHDKPQQTDVSVTHNKLLAESKETGKPIQNSSADEIVAPKERGVDRVLDHTADDFVILDSGISSTDELTSGSWVLEPKPSELVIEPAVEDEISESYDSDMDLENLDSLPAVRNQLRLLKSTSRLSNVDGTGYIYAFTDSSNDAKNHRIKVGASRQPYKKLQQATLFNVDVKLVSAVRVGSTKSALLDILGQLERYLIVDAKYWFLGPLDDILQILMETCMNYPVQQSPSTPSSPMAVSK